VVGELTAEHAKRLNLDQAAGVIVKSVEAGPARAAGIHDGDVITMFDNQPVTSPDQFRDLVAKARPGRSVAILVQRREGPMFLALRMPSK
jgi:serine protease Do